jgi:uncharacterized protein
LSAWSRPLDVERLADGGADVDFTVPLAELGGLRSERAGVAGSVRGRVRFGREAGVAVAELTLSGTATLVCQRCMQPMELPVHSVARVGLVGSVAEVARVPEDLEPMLAPGGRTSIGELVTEELLLSLPIVPLHAVDTGCGAASPTEAAPAPAGEATHRPFARLAELLKR